MERAPGVKAQVADGADIAIVAEDPALAFHVAARQ